MRRGSTVVLAAALLAAVPAGSPDPLAAQLSDPCELSCGAVLGASAAGVGLGGLVAWARHTGGVSTTNEALLIVGAGFALALGGGISLAGNGNRQERAVHGSGIGLVGGAALGLSVAALVETFDAPRAYSAAVIGAGAGALIGGLIGALTYEGQSIAGGVPQLSTIPLFTARLSF